MGSRSRLGPLVVALAAVAVCSACQDDRPDDTSRSQEVVSDPAGDLRSKAANTGVSVNSDVVEATLRRTDDELVVVLRYDDLSRGGPVDWGVWLLLGSSDDEYERQISWDRHRGPNGWEESVDSSKLTSEDAFANPCKELTVAVNYPDELVQVTVPVTCVEDPEWVEVTSLEAVSRYRSVNRADVVVDFDDPVRLPRP